LVVIFSATVAVRVDSEGLLPVTTGSQEGIFLAHGPENIMRETFGNIIEELPMKLSDLSEPVAVPPIPQVKYCVFECYSDTWIFTHIFKSRVCFWVFVFCLLYICFTIYHKEII
jgi:hypothetical protein